MARAWRFCLVGGVALAATAISGWALRLGPGNGPITARYLDASQGVAATGPRASDVLLIRVPADADATIDSARPDTPLGATPALTVGYALGAAGATAQLLLHFPLPVLPPGSAVVTATLLLDMVADHGQAEVAVTSAMVGEPWQESTVTWSNRPPLSPAGSRLVGPAPERLAIDVTWLVAGQWYAGMRNDGLALLVRAGECDAGRSRTFASREAPPATSLAPMLVIAYVGPGTPHPFPSPTATATDTTIPTPSASPSPSTTPTPSNTPTALPTSTGATPTTTWTPTDTATATATATVAATPTPTTSTFGQYKGKPSLIRPSDGLQLPQPIGDEVWVFEWGRLNGGHGPCLPQLARLTINGPTTSFSLDLPGSPGGGCYRYHADQPVAAGRWTWSVTIACANGPTEPSDSRSFYVAPPSITPTPGGATPTARPLWLPFARQERPPLR